MGSPAIHRAIQVLTNPASLTRRQRADSHLGQIFNSSCCSSGTVVEEVDTTAYGLDDNDVIGYAHEKGRKLPAILESTLANVLAWCTLCTGTQE